MDLIKEAKKRGYKQGTAIRYTPHAVDYIEGKFFEVENNILKVYVYPKHKRTMIKYSRFDTIFDGVKWTEIVDLDKRTEEQRIIDEIHDYYNFK